MGWRKVVVWLYGCEESSGCKNALEGEKTPKGTVRCRGE